MDGLGQSHSLGLVMLLNQLHNRLDLLLVDSMFPIYASSDASAFVFAAPVWTLTLNLQNPLPLLGHPKRINWIDFLGRTCSLGFT